MNVHPFGTFEVKIFSKVFKIAKMYERMWLKIIIVIIIEFITNISHQES